MERLYLYLEKLIDLLFPQECLVCGTTGASLCPTCQKNISNTVSTRDTTLPGALQVFSLLPYADPIKQLIWSCKFRNRKVLLPFIAALVSEHFPEELQDAEVIIPVPIHPHRYNERGFNQAEEFIRTSARTRSIQLLTEVLVRSTETRALYTLNRSERSHMMAHSISCIRPELVAGKKILVFDDIMTTGATLTECLHVLRDTGARSVRALTLCRA